MSVKLIVALGNEGDEYILTRHNLARIFLDDVVSKKNIGWNKEKSYFLAKEVTLNQTTMFAKLRTFMNLSGRPLKELLKCKSVDINNMLVICDDIDLPLGSLRIKPKGRDGGHRGLRSISQEVGTNDFARLRLGIGRGHENTDVVKHVLGCFSKKEKQVFPDIFNKALNAVEDFLLLDWSMLMSKYNIRV